MTSPTGPPLQQSDAHLALSRQEVHLQSTLQDLLDIQSEGLLAGFTSVRPQDASSSTGSRTPTTTSDTLPRDLQRPTSIIPVRQPAPKKIGLRGARRGITSTIASLAILKADEASLLREDLSRQDSALSTVNHLTSKTSALQSHIQSISSSAPTTHLTSLKKESNSLETEIHSLETTLYERRARQRHLLREIETVENSVQAKLSSYQNSLALANKDIKTFLARPPPKPDTNAAGIGLRTMGLWSLPKERRTLDLAGEWYGEEHARLRARLEAVDRERDALEEGGAVWEGVVAEVTSVERALRKEMQHLRPTTASLGPAPAGAGNDAGRGMRDVLRCMAAAKGKLEEAAAMAEERDWRLLVCAIGAELAALEEGLAVLEGAKGAGEGVGGGDKGGVADAGDGDGAGEVGVGTGEGALLAEGGGDEDEDEDEGPGPDLLVPRHDDG